MVKRNTTILFIFLTLTACKDQVLILPQDELSLFGKWRYVSHVLSSCTLDADNREDVCTGSAGECGILTLSEGAWSWEQTLPDGSVLKESGTYYLSTNAIILTGQGNPGTGKYSITGSTVSYTKTTLTFANYGISDGCFYTDTYVRYNQSGVVPS